MRERLLAYAGTLGIAVSAAEIQSVLNCGRPLAESLALLRAHLASREGGDFLAFRLHRGFDAAEAEFRRLPMERLPFPSAVLGSRTASGEN
ncbi:MAG: hypothetical protein ACRETQ_03430 [Gammaproteobacteria bacterium]